MSTGDLVNSLGKLESKLKKVKFTNYRRSDFLSGILDIYLAVYGYVFSSFNCEFSKSIAEKGLELYGKTNKHFVDNLYLILRDVLCYKPPITKCMFLTNRAFVEMKMIMCARILDLVLQKCEEFQSGRRRSGHCDTRIPGSRSGKSFINSCNEEPTFSVSAKHSSTSSLRELDNNTIYGQQNTTEIFSREHRAEDASSENEITNNYFIKPQIGKKLFHACSALGITRNYEITQFVLPRNSKGNVIFEKQKSSIDKIPVNVEMGPFVDKEKMLEPLITANKNLNLASNYIRAQCKTIQQSIIKTVKTPLTESHRNSERILNYPKEINNDSLMENVSQTLVESAKILQVLQQKNLEEKILSSKMSKGNSQVLGRKIISDQQQSREKEIVIKNQTLGSDITCKKELDYCIARMNLMECALKSLESKLEKL